MKQRLLQRSAASRFIRACAAAALLLSSACWLVVVPELWPPLEEIAGEWTGDVLGVNMRLVLEERPYASGEDLRLVSGSGWLVYGTPAESLKMSPAGTHDRESQRPLYIMLSTWANPGQWYGELRLKVTDAGTLGGTLKLRADRAPAFNPFVSPWPAGATSVDVSLRRP